jgi:hypothetical protein
MMHFIYLYLHLQNVPKRFITHLSTGVLGVEDPVLSETALSSASIVSLPPL